ncbi:MAG: DoxX family protein [Deltaproteobacteria bacterium]|nr:DoxX family protein [Deltaproteobacteria bacterium]
MKKNNLFSTIDCWGLIFIRLALGAIFMAHGGQKLFGWAGGAGFEGTIQFFETTWGIPMPLTILAMVTEFFGGLAVLLGCLTRLAALGLAAVMGVAIYKVHYIHGFFLNWSCSPDLGHGVEFNVALLAMAITLLFSGAGHLSVDKWLGK